MNDDLRELSMETLAKIRALTEQQANDPGLWALAETATEGYLQQELRRLHSLIEEEPKDGEG